MTWSRAIKAIRDGISSHQHRAVSSALLIALGLIVTMAIVSSTTIRIHPDEFDHIGAARFYVENWLPPPVADPRTLDSYSNYGMSYLNEWDIVYPLAGKWASLVRPVIQSEVYALRSFNVLLFALLTCMAWFRRDEILTFSILVLSPQIWYVFSYFNADAFPMFVSVLAAHEITSSRSSFNDRARSLPARCLRLGLYIGLIILSKKTFWMFAVFAFCLAAFIELWRSRSGDWRQSFRQTAMLMVVLAVIGSAIALPRICYDLYINGSPAMKGERIVATANLLADKEYKPSQIAAGGGAYSRNVHLKSKGTRLSRMLFRKGWLKQSVESSFGVYDYMSLYAPAPYYVLAASCFALLVATLSFSIIRKGGALDGIVLSWAMACCLGILSLSVYHSWVNDFQPQGRYLFGIFVIVGVLLVRSKEILNSLLVNGLIGVSFLLGTYSFVFIGLNHIPKYWENVERPSHPFLRLEREWKQKLPTN